MNASRSLQSTAWLLAGCGLLPAAQPCARAAGGDEEITAVYSRVATDYARTKLPDGSFAPETFAFGEGGRWAGQTGDATIDKLSFIKVARMIAGPLGRQGFVQAKDPQGTKLLIMVYWGTTAGTSATGDSLAYLQAQQADAAFMGQMSQARDAMGNTPTIVRGIGAIDAFNALNQGLDMAALANRQRDQTDRQNARLLGYDSEGLIGTEYGALLDGTPLRFHRDDLVSEVEESRYFVVLVAYDFQMTWKQKKHREFWETRFSIRQLGHDFGRDLPAMAQYASHYFGRDSHGLVRKAVPLGRVEVGEPQTVGVEPQK